MFSNLLIRQICIPLLLSNTLDAEDTYIMYPIKFGFFWGDKLNLAPKPQISQQTLAQLLNACMPAWIFNFTRKYRLYWGFTGTVFSRKEDTMTDSRTAHCLGLLLCQKSNRRTATGVSVEKVAKQIMAERINVTSCYFNKEQWGLSMLQISHISV